MRWCRQSKYVPTLFPNLFASFSARKKSHASGKKLWLNSRNWSDICWNLFSFKSFIRNSICSVCWWMETVATLANLPHVFPNVSFIYVVVVLFPQIEIHANASALGWVTEYFVLLNSDALVENRDEDDEGTGHIFLLGLWKSICPTVVTSNYVQRFWHDFEGQFS